MKSFFRFVLMALVLLVVALVSALTAMRFAIHGSETAVPNLVNKTPIEARRIADAAGFQMEVERQYYSANVPEGRILSQVPASGTQVRRGWQIRVASSLGPQRVEIPNVLGESHRAAEINILRRGLDVGAIAQVAMRGPATDQVLGQSPPPNASGIAAPKISLLTNAPAPPQAFLMPNFTGQALGGVTLVCKTRDSAWGMSVLRHQLHRRRRRRRSLMRLRTPCPRLCRSPRQQALSSRRIRRQERRS